MNTYDHETDSALILEQLLRLIIDMPADKRLSLLNQLEEIAFEEDPSIKRDDSRKAYNKPVSFDFENFTYSGAIKDISTTGMFIETDESFKIGQLIMVNIPDSSDQSFVRVAGEIIRTESDGIGVQFLTKSKE